MGGGMSLGGDDQSQQYQQNLQHQQNQQHSVQQQPLGGFQPLATPTPHQPTGGEATGIMSIEMMHHGVSAVGGGMMNGMGGGMISGMGGMGGGYQQAGIQAAPQRPAKKVPDWLIQTLKEKEALAEKQKKKEGISLSTDIASVLQGGVGNISGYSLVHSPSPSPPGSPTGGGVRGKSKPSWHETDDSDDNSDDEVSPTANRNGRISNGSTANAGGQNGPAKPAGILKGGGMKKRGSAGRPVEEADDDDDMNSPAAEASDEMDKETRAAFDREIRRLLTTLLKEGTANISREVATSVVEEARHFVAARRRTQPRPSQATQPAVLSKKEQREQKKAMGALIGGYGSESSSNSEGEASPPPHAAAPSATVLDEVEIDGTGSLVAGGQFPQEMKEVEEGGKSAIGSSIGGPVVGAKTVGEDPRVAVSSAPAGRKVPVMVGGKWLLPDWADPPHTAPLPAEISVAVETIGPNLERMKMQDLVFNTTVMGRFEEQCGFVVEDGSASRYHAAIL